MVGVKVSSYGMFGQKVHFGEHADRRTVDYDRIFGHNLRRQFLVGEEACCPFLVRDTKTLSIPKFSRPRYTALEAPPVPRISAFLWWGCSSGSMDCVNPMMSELQPISLTFPLGRRMILMTLTAPILAVSLSSSSR